MSLRINQFLAKHLDISRRQADNLIKSGLVEINGYLAEFYQKVQEKDKVRVFLKQKWQELENNNSHKEIVVLMYKPIFCLTSHKDPQNRKTVFDFLPKKFKYLKTAGRLDYMSEGLLVLSNNGNLIFKLTHPSQGTKKKYLVASKYPIANKDLDKLHFGFFLKDGDFLQSMQVQKLSLKDLDKWRYLKLDPKHHWYEFTLKEGKKNQIRRLLENLNNKVYRLIRIQHGEFILTADLKEKKYLIIQKNNLSI